MSHEQMVMHSGTRIKASIAKPLTLARLNYVDDTRPGYTRRRSGKRWLYFDTRGRRIADERTIKRLDKLAVPPAYEDVWLSPDPRGHIQAIGRDARGRKQYRYHADWRAVRDAHKYDRMLDFALALPRIRRSIAAHLRQRGLPREKVLATVVKLLEKTLIRVGNEEYARDNASYGLTTLRQRHVNVRGTRIRFSFKGKSGIFHKIDFEDERLSAIVRRCQELPGHEMFQYLDEEGKRREVRSDDVNEYLKDIAGHEFTAKDFRTWAGTLLAAKSLSECPPSHSPTEAKRQANQAIESVAKRLGNTKAICRKCYIHPLVLESHMDGSLSERLQSPAGRLPRALARLNADEGAIVALLRGRARSS
jgi:DNA topoisomerase-1